MGRTGADPPGLAAGIPFCDKAAMAVQIQDRGRPAKAWSLPLALAAVLGVSPGRSEEIPDPAFLARMGDHVLTMRMQVEFAEAVTRSKPGVVKAMAARIRAEDGLHIAALRDRFLRDAAGPLGQTIALRLNACQLAGIALRSMIVETGAGTAKAVVRAGTIMVDGTLADTDFEDNFRRCQMINRVERRQPLIQTDCLQTGRDCPYDPDQPMIDARTEQAVEHAGGRIRESREKSAPAKKD